MSAMAIPKTVIQAIDRRRRTFFWTGEDKCHGSKCLVAWDTLQLNKNSGGLGVKDLELQNRCLLMKFIDKLFSSTDAPWKSWVLRDASAHDSGGSGGIASSGELSTTSYLRTDLSPWSSCTMVPPPPSGTTTGCQRDPSLLPTLLFSPTR
jgi:hypothetical protein